MSRRVETGDMRQETRAFLIRLIVLGSCLVSHVSCPDLAFAAVSSGETSQMEAGGTNQGGGGAGSQNFRQQASIGGGMATHRISSSRWNIIPGLFGGGGSSGTLPPVDALDLTVVYAKTSPMGETIAAATWQPDRDPIFIWEPPETGAEVAGYSFAMDAAPDDTIDTVGTSYDIAVAGEALSEGKHTFSVKALNTAGNGGAAASLELWVDPAPPQIAGYSPAPGALLNTSPAITVSATDGGSGISATSAEVLVNGQPVAVSFADGTITAGSVTWAEGINSIELRLADLAGNEQTPLVWSVTIDRVPPAGTVTINAGAALTTSPYVTLSLSATDATSPVTGMLISNDPASGFVQEPFAASRELWPLVPIRGPQSVFVKFTDKAGNVSAAVTDLIDLALLSPETTITSGPAGFTPQPSATFTFMCPEGGCVFSYVFDDGEWSEWSTEATAAVSGLAFGNHYFRVKAAKDVNGLEGIQPDEEDPSPAERTWIVGVEPTLMTIPRGPAIKVWRLE